MPGFVNKLKQVFEAEKAKMVIPGDEVHIDFRSGLITYRGEEFRFPPLGTVPQSLVIAGGVENLVARRLGLREKEVATR